MRCGDSNERYGPAVSQGAAYYAIACDYFFASVDTIFRCNKFEEMKAFQVQ